MRAPGPAAALVLLSAAAAAAGPETSQREFASSQIKKGVRALGMGGDGATVGNYALVWKDEGTAVADAGVTAFSDTGNRFQFTAVGFSTPKLPGDIGVFVVAMSEWGSGIRVHLKSPAFAAGAGFEGEGSDEAVFVKLARPLGNGFSLGALVGYEHSVFTATANGGAGTVNYGTGYRPSGGAGLTWEAGKLLLAGVRVLTSQDLETRTDSLGAASGLLSSWEVRGGAAVRPLPWLLLDLGYAGLARRSGLDRSSSFESSLVAGAELALLDDHLWLRGGWNETSPTAGLSVRGGPLKLDLAYVQDLGVSRTRELFGQSGSSVIATLSYDYAR